MSGSFWQTGSSYFDPQFPIPSSSVETIREMASSNLFGQTMFCTRHVIDPKQGDLVTIDLLCYGTSTLDSGWKPIKEPVVYLGKDEDDVEVFAQTDGNIFRASTNIRVTSIVSSIQSYHEVSAEDIT